MSVEVGIRQIEFDAAILSLGARSENLNTSVSDVPSINCQAETMRRYREVLPTLSALLDTYVALLRKDRANLKSVHDAIARIDLWLSSHMG